MLSETLKAADLHLNPFLQVSVRLLLFLYGVCVQGHAGVGVCQEPAMGGEGTSHVWPKVQTWSEFCTAPHSRSPRWATAPRLCQRHLRDPLKMLFLFPLKTQNLNGSE